MHSLFGWERASASVEVEQFAGRVMTLYKPCRLEAAKSLYSAGGDDCMFSAVK